jgi:hypothetical protein
VEKLTEEKYILKVKNETLENEKDRLIEKLIEISTEFEQDNNIWKMKMKMMCKDSEAKRM